MGRETPWAIFIGTFISGLFFGIYIQTGISIAPEDLTLQIGDEIVKQTADQSLKSTWQVYSLLFLIVGIIITIAEIVFIYLSGPIYIISAITGFLGGLLVVLWPNLGVWFVIGGAIFSQFFTPQKPYASYTK
jgi:hypothetical protein